MHAGFFDPGGPSRVGQSDGLSYSLADSVLPSATPRAWASTNSKSRGSFSSARIFRCLRFVTESPPSSRKTRFRLVTSPWPGRVRTCKVPQMVSPAANALGSSISKALPDAQEGHWGLNPGKFLSP